jgi:hypothetical protein
MKVFVPHKKDRNVYFDEIINFSKNEFVFGYYKEFDTSYDIVNIQFPEAIFDFKLPTQNQLDDLELEIKKWKENSKIVLILNDDKSHYDLENKFGRLFELMYQYVDAVVHLGKFSLETNQKYFSKNCQHTIIYHPLYESLRKDFITQNIEEKIALNFEGRFVVVAIGAIRSKEEAKFLLKVFKKIPQENKLLVVPNMFPFWQLPSFLPYRFRKIYKWIMMFLYCFPIKKDQYFFGYNFIDYPYMIDLVKKSSLMIIPRLRNLNSGNLFLGLTFDKPMVIPKIGNLVEVAHSFNFPLLDLKLNNFIEVINKITSNEINKYLNTDNYQEVKNKFHPEKIANEYDLFFNKIVKD